MAGATAPEPLPYHNLVEADLWDQLPADLPELLALLPHADLYLPQRCSERLSQMTKQEQTSMFLRFTSVYPGTLLLKMPMAGILTTVDDER